MTIIKIEDLTKEFNYYKKQEGFLGSIKGLFKREKLTKYAVKNVNFEINEGEFVGFIGPNGAGKTTTIKMLSGILTPSSGSIESLGYTPSERKADYLKQIGVVLGQKNQINPDLPPIETFLMFKAIYGIDDDNFKEKLDELIKLLDVADIIHVQARRLSLGQRMKCELIAALLHSPKILFLDEPTIGLDVTSQRNIREFLAEYNKKHKTTIILTSHYMQDIERLCKRVVIIDLGKIVFDGTLLSLTEKYVKFKKIEVALAGSGKIDCSSVEKYGKVLDCADGKLALEVPRGNVAKVTSHLINDFDVLDLEVSEMDIEEIITDVFKKNSANKEK
ncbi:MAG: ATP-binding cassette domain-containing protein [bacterium]